MKAETKEIKTDEDDYWINEEVFDHTGSYIIHSLRLEKKRLLGNNWKQLIVCTIRNISIIDFIRIIKDRLTKSGFVVPEGTWVRYCHDMYDAMFGIDTSDEYASDIASLETIISERGDISDLFFRSRRLNTELLLMMCTFGPSFYTQTVEHRVDITVLSNSDKELTAAVKELKKIIC